MTLQELQDALAKGTNLTIKSGQVRVGDKTFPVRSLTPFDVGEGIEIAYGRPVDGDDGSTVVGKTSSLFLEEGLNILKSPAEVRATFKVAANEDAFDVTLRYEVKNWRFLDVFPFLPLPFDPEKQRYDYESGKSIVDATFALRDCYFYLTTYDHSLTKDKKFADGFLFLKEGLTFAGQGAPQGALGLLAELGDGKNSLHGRLVTRPSGSRRRLELDQLPWDAEPAIPGIYLKLPLVPELSVPSVDKAWVKFTDFRFEMYCPLNRYWSFDASYQPVMAYLGNVEIGKLKLLTASASVVSGRDDELVFACTFDKGITLDALLNALTAKPGTDESYSFLPEPLQKVIGSIGPRSASITLVRSGKSYEVAAAKFTIGLSKTTWKPFDHPFENVIGLGFTSVKITVVKPFDGQQRAFYATIGGKATFLGIELDLKLEAPSFYISAEQIGTKTVDLEDCFKQHNVRWPLTSFKPKFEIANITLVAEPGSYYSFGMDISPSRKLRIGNNEYALPNLHLAVSCTTEKNKSHLNWEFEARTAPGQEAVPVVKLIEYLASEVADFKIPIKDLPAAIQGLAVTRLALSYSSKSQDFAFQCWGTLPLNEVDLECRFTIDKKHEPSKTVFGGQILLRPEGQAPLSFSLMFGKEDNSKYCLAAYNDQYGYELNIQGLANSVSPELGKLIPASLGMTLNSALLAYYGKSATESAADNSGAESVVLFGVDLAAKVKLSDLPIVGSAMPSDQAVGFESLRILVASDKMSQGAVESLNGLLPYGVKPLPDRSQSSGEMKASSQEGLQKGFNVSAALLLGTAPYSLDLPVPEKRLQASNTEVAGASTPSNTDDGTKWFEIGKSLGPISFQRIGLGYAEGRVGVKFDASLQLSALTFSLDGLGMTYPLDKFTEPSQFLKHVKFTLDGMGLALGSGPIEIGGSLVRIPPTSSLRKLELEGTLLIRSTAFTFSAFGSYIDENGTISVMAFAVLLAELGDPTATGAFLVTGLAFGFGVNRKLRLPTIEQVQDFPLVKAAMGEDSFAARKQLPAQLREYVSPAAGNFWIAAGIKFNSFAMIDSFLLVSVSWGAEVEIGLLGLSRMTTPPRVTPDKTIACAELALRGVIRIAEGLVQFEARLTENSFIFSSACRLTGGFAFCLWFAGPHAGDFVVSLGGYHPAFVRPAHYPLVPRLGMQLQIGNELSITGEAYFALTPSCIMAGGKLCAVFKLGGIEAWFIAYADFLMSWQPFYYQAAMGITLGVALRLGAIAIRLELSVDLKLQGPPFGGEALVRLWVISFTIPFGAHTPAPPALKPREFVTNCLPAPRDPKKDKSPEVFSVRITRGLLREQEVEVMDPETGEAAKRTYRIVNAHQLSLTAQSVIPCTELEGLATGVGAKCGIRPMGKRNLHSPFKVTADRIEPGKHVKVSAVTGNVPDAVWGICAVEDKVPLPKTPDTKTIEATLGIRIDGIPQHPVGSLLEIRIEKFRFAPILKSVDWALLELPTYAKPEEKWTDYSTVWSDPAVVESRVEQNRNAVLAYLRKQLPRDLVLNKPDLKELSKNSDYFQEHPEMNAVGY